MCREKQHRQGSALLALFGIPWASWKVSPSNKGPLAVCVLIPGPVNVTLSGNRVFAHVIKSRISWGEHPGFGVGPTSNAWCPYKRTERVRWARGVPGGCGGRGGAGRPTAEGCQGLPAATGRPERPERPLREPTLPTPWLLSSRTGRAYVSIVLSHPVCSNLLWQL